MESILSMMSGAGLFGSVALATGFTFSMTALGAFFVYFLSSKGNPKVKSMTLGFAAGIMIAASVWSLLIPAIELTEEAGGTAWIPAAGGFALGVAFLALLDRTLPHQHADENEPEGIRTQWRKTTLLVLAVTLHNIPEGMSVGLAIASASISGESAAMAGALALALGMGLQNIPEGTAVSMPLHECGMSKHKAFGLGALSGLVEPIFGLLTVMALPLIAPYMAWFLAFAAGAMMYVVAEELIPSAKISEHSDLGTISVMAGFLLMMVLDVALG